VHIRLIAVGDRQPSWVDTAFETYVQRLPRQWQFRLDLIATAPRSKNSDAETAKIAEGQKVLAKIKALAARLEDWQSDGRDLTFVIGGPDGVSEDCMNRADLRWSLSRLTLPHGLARVTFAEQLYRSWTLTTGHPYHRS